MNYRIPLLALLVFFCAWKCPVSAQNNGLDIVCDAHLVVKVLEAVNDSPVQMATVYVVPVGDTIAVAFTFTDKKGIASFSRIPAGRYVLNVQMLGFKPHKEEIQLEPRMLRSFSVKMEEDCQELEGATITAKGDLVTTKGDTLVYNAASFRTSSNANLGELLKKMPGIEVEKGQVKVNGEPVTKITVEGKTFFLGDQSKALENLPAYIVSKINVIDEESRDKYGLGQKRKKMDVRLKEEFRNGWFGKVSAEGGISVKDESSNLFDDTGRALYNGKLYSSFYGDNDQLTLIGGGNNVNAAGLSHNASGVSDIASAGVNYNTSRIPEMQTVASVSYDFKDNDDRAQTRRTSFQSSGGQIVTDRYQSNNDINHSIKAHFDIGNTSERSFDEGFHVGADFFNNRRIISRESLSSTGNSVEQLNSSESGTSGHSDDFSVDIGFDAQYFLDKKSIHHLSFRGGMQYNSSRGNSNESSRTCFKESAQAQNLLYDDSVDGLQLNGILSYYAQCSSRWDILSTASVDYGSSRDRRDASNADDCSRNESYSKYAKDRNIDLTESVTAKYSNAFGGNKRFNTSFGLCVYEDNVSHFSIQSAKENRSNLWNINVGPVAAVTYNDFKNSYTISTTGKSSVPSNGADSSPILDVSDPVSISAGNIYLKSGYHQDLVLRMRLCPESKRKAVITMVLRGSVNLNDITPASWYDSSAVRYSIPVNSKRPRYNAVLDVTYVQTLNKKKSLNLTISPKLSFSNATNYVSNGPLRSLDKEDFDYAEMMRWFYGDSDGSEFYSGRSGFSENQSLIMNLSLKADLKYEIRDYSIRCGGSVDNGRKDYSASPCAAVNNWRFNAFTELLWQNDTGWEFETRFDYYGYKGFSDNYNRPEYLLNIRLSKAVRSFAFSLSAYDILDSAKSFYHVSSAEYVEDVYHNNIGRCILIGLSYNFGKWDRFAQSRQQQMEKNRNL